MTDDQKRMAIALNQCTFVPGIGTKRFARQMADMARSDIDWDLSVKQAKYLASAVIRFRRQIFDGEVLAIANKELLRLGP